MQFSDEILSLCAPELPALTSCDLLDVAELPDYVLRIALQQKLGVSRYKDPNVVVCLIAFVSRLDAAIREYAAARTRLREYLSALPEHNHLRSHALAVSNFESCVLHAWPMFLCLERLVFLFGVTPPARVKGSEYDRLRELNNRLKHFDEDILQAAKGGTVAVAAPMWLTNDALKCERSTLTYRELADALIAASADAKAFCVDMLASK